MNVEHQLSRQPPELSYWSGEHRALGSEPRPIPLWLGGGVLRTLWQPRTDLRSILAQFPEALTAFLSKAGL